MSIPVDTAALAEAVDRYGAAAFLLSSAPRGGPHAVAVRVAWDGTALTTRAGNTSRTNISGRAEVTLLWPPVGEDDYSLIVDGTASVEGTDGVRVSPVRAVLHRNPATTPTDDPGSECVTVLRSTDGQVRTGG
jgi:hypothetical protein